MKKTAFRAGSSGLYEFTHMPFGLTSAGSSFCHLMEQCLGDQQLVTLLLYLDDICIFALSTEVMLYHIELVFNSLKEYYLKVKPKKYIFFDTSVLFWGHVLSAREISANPKKVEKVWDRPTPTNAKEVHSFLGLVSYYQRFIPTFAQMALCLHELVGTDLTKAKKMRGQKKEKPAAQKNPTEEKVFNWMPEHQQAFDAKRLFRLQQGICVGNQCFFARFRGHVVPTG